MIGFGNQTSGKQMSWFLHLYILLKQDQFLLWNQTCRHLIMLVAAITLPSLMWKPCFFPQMPQGMTEKKIQRLPRNLNPRSNKQKNNASKSISSNWNQICRHLIMLVAATTLSSLMWKPCFFPQMPPGTTKKKIQPLRLFFSFLSTALCHQKFSSPSLSVLLKNYNTVHFIVHSTQNC